MTMTTGCSCTTTNTYRELDRACPTHGDAAEAARRDAMTTAAGEVVAIRGQVAAASAELIEQLGADEPRAYRAALELLERHDEALERAVEQLLVALDVPANERDAARSDATSALLDYVQLGELSEAVSGYRERAEQRAVATTVDLGPLLAFRAECEEMALRFMSGQPPTQEEHRAFERRVEPVEDTFRDQILAACGDIDAKLGRLAALRAYDALTEIAAMLTGTLPLSVLADEAFVEDGA